MVNLGRRRDHDGRRVVALVCNDDVGALLVRSAAELSLSCATAREAGDLMA